MTKENKSHTGGKPKQNIIFRNKNRGEKIMKNYNISESEWKIMQVLWNNENFTMKEINAALGDTDWSYSTIKTLVLRLHKKGAIGADTTIGNFKYYPIANENDCRKKEAKNLVNRIYGGSVKMLMASLTDESKLTDREIKQLMSIIDKMEN